MADTVLQMLPCAAISNGCTSSVKFYASRSIDIWDLDPAVPEDVEVAELLGAAGWRLDHGKWICGNHEPATPPAPLDVLVPREAFDQLVKVARYVSLGRSAVGHQPDGAPYPDVEARFALGALHEAGLTKLENES